MSDERKIRVVIIDDHAMTRMGLSFMLKTFPDITLLGEAESGVDGVNLCVAQAPDVVLLDMRLPDQDGPKVAVALRSHLPTLKIIALSSFDDHDLIKRALQAGAISYVLKNVSALELAEAIRRAFQGKATLAPEAMQVLVEQIQRVSQPQIELTERERGVLQLMARGHSNGQIAEQLFISPATVKGHIRTILNKLDVDSRSEAIAQAWASGLVDRKGDEE